MGPKRKAGDSVKTTGKKAKKEPTPKKPSPQKAPSKGKKPSKTSSESKVGNKPSKNSKKVETEVTSAAPIIWDWVDGRKGRSLLVGSMPDDRKVQKIASFDLDGTLIETKSGDAFAKNKNDWKWKFDSVVPRIKALWNDGFNIVIFTNQGGVQGENRKAGKSEEAARVDALCGRLEGVVSGLGVPVLVLAATASDLFRKPMTGMWDVMKERLQAVQKAPLDICLSDSFFVGDAAGRPKGWKKGAPQDFSCTDRKFASNLRLQFQTPEECFEGAAAFPLTKVEWGEHFRDWLLDDETATTVDKANEAKITAVTSELEVVICVGMPGAGKSSACKDRLFGHAWINQDTLGSADRCARLVRENLNEGKSVVVDCTNPSADHRRMYSRIAKDKKATARVLYFNTPRAVAEHLNILREVTSNGARTRVPQIAYRQYQGQFEAPSKELDLIPVSTIEFCPRFATPKDKEVFCTFTS